MLKVNSDYCKLPGSYLFSEIARIVSDFAAAHPEVDIIRMGIGDVTQPLCEPAIRAIHEAAERLSRAETFRGYGPEQGHRFLREAIAEGDYRSRGIDVSPDEIFISDGAKSDIGNIGDIISADARVAVTDPVYPVYVDTSVMAGRAGTLGPDGRWSRLVYIPVTEDNGFVPRLPEEKVDVIYLCYPNNPTGTTLTRAQLQPWVDYCRQHGSLLIFDAAYEAYVTSADVPRSIYELPGAREVAIEFRSFSKTAGFTGLRLGYTVVPHTLVGLECDGNPVSLHRLWLRRQTTKFNGASYVSQCAGAALYTPEGRKSVADGVNYYLENARLLRESISASGLKVWGGVDSPYLWVKTPDGLTSREFFTQLLHRHGIVTTPGAGFGPSGEGYVRLTAFNTRENTIRAAARMAENLK